MYKRFLRVVAVGLAFFAMSQVPALADDKGKDKDKDNNKLQAVPFAFVGTMAQCGGPAGSRIVTSAWLTGMGLPDNGGQNTTAVDLATNPNKNDPHTGLLLSKNGPTADCSAAGATIKGVKGMKVDALFALGYDYRNGGHCGAGAPRFNVDTDKGFFFVGCANSPQTPAPQDLLQWTRTRSVLVTCGVECFPSAIPVGATINSIDLIFDEGTDSPSLQDPNGVGLAVLDNIFINGQTITRGDTNCKNDDHGD